MINKNCYFDEKQLIDRGKSFKYGFITAIMTLLVEYFCTSALNIKIDPFAEFLVLIWIPITVCFISFIVKNAYEGVNSRTGRIVCIIMGCCGLYLVIATIVEVIIRVEHLVVNGEISASFGHLFSGICLVIICITYCIRQYRNKKELAEE